MSRRGFWLRHAVWPLALLAVAALLVHALDLDARVAGLFYDAANGGFPGRNDRWLRGLHAAERWLPATVGGGAVLLWLASFVEPAARPLRRGALYLALCFALGPGLVSLGKQVTNVDCPWDLERYGGDRPQVGLFERRPEALPPGRCLPSGHASGAYAFFGLYFLLRRYRPRAAPAALAVAVALGLSFGLTQWARGAHFVSHDLGSAALCWIVALSLAAACLRRRRTGAGLAPAVLRTSAAH